MGSQRQEERPDAAAGGEHEQRAPRREPEPVEHLQRRAARDRRGRSVDEIDRRIQPDRVVGRHDDQLRVPTAARREGGHGNDSVADGQSIDVRSHCIDHTRDVVTQHARQGQPGPRPIPAVARVHRVRASRVYGDPHLAGRGHWIRPINQRQLIRAAEGLQDNGFHWSDPMDRTA